MRYDVASPGTSNDKGVDGDDRPIIGHIGSRRDHIRSWLDDIGSRTDEISWRTDHLSYRKLTCGADEMTLVRGKERRIANG
jgi:hypothetical protein